MTGRIRAVFPSSSCGLAIVGEAPGEQEINEGIPFVGKSGQLLNATLAEIGIDRTRCMVTNVFMTRPPDNKVDHFFCSIRHDGDPILNRPLFRGKVVKPEHEFELDRLNGELIRCAPRLILVLGNTALWAVTRVEGITASRGRWISTYNGALTMPTWHPSAVLRDMNKIEEFAADIFQVKERLETVDPEVLAA